MTRRPLWRRGPGERGQTFTEYVMVLGLVAAIIASLTQVVVPGVVIAVRRVVGHMTVYLTSVQP